MKEDEAPLLLHVRHSHHDRRCPPLHGPGWLRLHAGVSVSPVFPDGCSASTLGSFFTCIPSSCLPLPAQRPLAWERWGMEAGAPVAPLCWGCICPSRSGGTASAGSEAAPRWGRALPGIERAAWRWGNLPWEMLTMPCAMAEPWGFAPVTHRSLSGAAGARAA